MVVQLLDQLSTVAEEATSLKAQDDDALEDEDGHPTVRTADAVSVLEPPAMSVHAWSLN